MAAEEISAAAANFPQCLESLWPAAARRHISRATFIAQTAALTPDLRIMDLIDSQPEFTKSFWDYLDILVTDARIAKGRELLDKYRTAFDAVEKAYGVDRYHSHRDLGRRDQLRHHRRRPASVALDRDIGLRRPPAEIFPRRISLDARDHPARRRGPGSPQSARGPARSGRPNSCRRRSRNSRSISTAMVGAT